MLVTVNLYSGVITGNFFYFYFHFHFHFLWFCFVFHFLIKYCKIALNVNASLLNYNSKTRDKTFVHLFICCWMVSICGVSNKPCGRIQAQTAEFHDVQAVYVLFYQRECVQVKGNKRKRKPAGTEYW